MIEIIVVGQVPNPALIGYWRNLDISDATYIPLDQVDSRYNIITVSFAAPKSGTTDGTMKFAPVQVTPSIFKTQIQTLQNQGKKVLISIGGEGEGVILDSNPKRDQFVSTI